MKESIKAYYMLSITLIVALLIGFVGSILLRSMFPFIILYISCGIGITIIYSSLIELKIANEKDFFKYVLFPPYLIFKGYELLFNQIKKLSKDKKSTKYKWKDIEFIVNSLEDGYLIRFKDLDEESCIIKFDDEKLFEITKKLIEEDLL